MQKKTWLLHFYDNNTMVDFHKELFDISMLLS